MERKRFGKDLTLSPIQEKVQVGNISSLFWGVNLRQCMYFVCVFLNRVPVDNNDQGTPTS